MSEKKSPIATAEKASIRVMDEAVEVVDESFPSKKSLPTLDERTKRVSVGNIRKTSNGDEHRSMDDIVREYGEVWEDEESFFDHVTGESRSDAELEVSEALDQRDESSRQGWFSKISSTELLMQALEEEERLSPRGIDTDYSNEFIKRIIDRLPPDADVEQVVTRVFHRDARLIELLLRVLPSKDLSTTVPFDTVFTAETFTSKLHERETIVDENGREYSSAEILKVFDEVSSGDAPITALNALPEAEGIRQAAFRVRNIATYEVQQAFGRPTIIPDVSLLRPEILSSKEPNAELSLAERKTISTFESQFGITATELESIEGWESLQDGQKQLILENLADLTVGRITEEAEEGYKDELAAEKAHKTVFGSHFLRKVWVGFRESFLSNKHLAEKEQVLAEQSRSGGLKEHGSTLRELVSEMRDRGPKAYYDEHNELVVEYARERTDMNTACKAALKRFNHVAYYEGKKVYEDTPAHSYQQLQQEKKNLSRYEAGRQKLIEEMEASGISPEDSLLYIAEADKQIAMAQFERSHPEALKTLGEIEDRNIWYAALKNSYTEGGLYAAGGYAARTVAAGLLGSIAIPVVAAGIGGWRGWKRSEALLREQDRLQREGYAVDEKTARNMINVEGKEGAVAKLQLLVKRLEEIDSIVPSDQNELIVIEAKRAKVLASLKERIIFTEDKLKLGLVNFGSNTRTNQYMLLKELSAVKIFTIDATSDAPLHTRLGHWITRKEKQLDQRRMLHQAKHVAKGALFAGSFSYLGSIIADYFSAEPAVTVAPEEVPNKPLSSGGEGLSHGSVVGGGEEQGMVEPVENELVSESVEASTVYRVRFGDTLIHFLKEHLGTISQIETMHGQDTAVENFLTKLSPEELRSVGITSGDPDVIFVGEDIDIGKLTALYQEKGG